MRRLPAEWEAQSFVQFTFPHAQTDWASSLDEATNCFVEIIETVARFEPVLVGGTDVDQVASRFSRLDNINLVKVKSNDTWARDHGAITVLENNSPSLLDFQFNGWGKKYAASLDNQITSHLHNSGLFAGIEMRKMNFVLEGGSIESDGSGTLMTTSKCLLEQHRNPHLTQNEIELFLKKVFGVNRMLWLNHGELAGDDTDGHIDTLARFCDQDTIAYVKCDDESDVHFPELSSMEEQLKTFVKANGEPYQLQALPFPKACFNKAGDRLPATYANFLICNSAVLVPVYGVQQDEAALRIIQELFPSRETIGINCLPLIQQGGSLHCITMQYPKSVHLTI